MKLSEYLDGLRAATTAQELEAALQADFKHGYRGRTWSQICKVREEVGLAICAAHPNGRFVPMWGPGRKMTLLGETYRVGRGGNSTGVRYAWHAAGVWAMDLMRREGLSVRASHRVWECWGSYPHRCLVIIEKALAGDIPDPVMNTLIPRKLYGHEEPIRYTGEQNDADQWDRRASMPCPACGDGTIFDWGAGHSEGFDSISWHCNGCPASFTEYVTRDRMREIRQPRTPVLAGETSL
ncbi:MAG TPA: hypothetical protein VF503_30535 [Sphingobium sp.]|uniref:hypothetical protein n=1 Tax=Sphingobium sp. TaxID=1912891 RepID=UPI002ED5A521